MIRSRIMFGDAEGLIHCTVSRKAHSKLLTACLVWFLVTLLEPGFWINGNGADLGHAGAQPVAGTRGLGGRDLRFLCTECGCYDDSRAEEKRNARDLWRELILEANFGNRFQPKDQASHRRHSSISDHELESVQGSKNFLEPYKGRGFGGRSINGPQFRRYQSSKYTGKMTFGILSLCWENGPTGNASFQRSPAPMASESTALIRVEDSRPEPEPSDSIVPLHRRNTLTVMYSGPGLSMLQLATYGGKAFQSIANYCFSGPKNPKLWIDNFFGNDGERQAALDNLHHHNRKLPTTPAIQKHHKELRNRCHKLLSYARPQSHTVDTQLVTFKMLVAIIPRYPGIRDCGTEWIFYRDFAVFCITDSGPLTVLVEGKLPSKLGRLELVGGNLSTVPTEALLAD
ncbi:hypothetical protein FB451DRAFT_1363458, partial [Mycena latifolia]